MKQNAITAEAKAQRRADFLRSARALFLQQQRLPAVADIAADTGLAKGNSRIRFPRRLSLLLKLLSLLPYDLRNSVAKRMKQ